MRHPTSTEGRAPNKSHCQYDRSAHVRRVRMIGGPGPVNLVGGRILRLNGEGNCGGQESLSWRIRLGRGDRQAHSAFGKVHHSVVPAMYEVICWEVKSQT
jgi:hypothetical protein